MDTLNTIFEGILALASILIVFGVISLYVRFLYRIVTLPVRLIAKQVVNERRIEQPRPFWNAAGRAAGRLFR